MGYWDDDDDATAPQRSTSRNFVVSRGYTRLHGGRGRSKRLRIPKLDGRKGKGVLPVPRRQGKGVLVVPRPARVRVVRAVAKSFGTRIRNAYGDMMMGFTRSCTIR